MPIPVRTGVTLADYLALEASTRTKHEFFDGEVFAMSGASLAHNQIVANTVATLHQQLRGKPCQVFPSDLRVKVGPSGLYTYPDAIVVCGSPVLEPPADTLLNPTIIVEVLSESSEAYDRGAKFKHYRSLASIAGYLLIAQDRVLVEHYARQAGDQWLLTARDRIEESLMIESIDCRLALAEIYLNVDLGSSD